MVGEIGVNSVVGKGSTFFFELPFSIAHVYRDIETKSNDQIDAKMGHIYPLKILLVEDNVINQKVIKLLFNKLGYQIDITENGKQAVEAVLNNHYDLVFMDIHMPEMDGFEATKQILRQTPVKFRPQIIAMTASATVEDRSWAESVGMNGFCQQASSCRRIKTSNYELSGYFSCPQHPR